MGCRAESEIRLINFSLQSKQTEFTETEHAKPQEQDHSYNRRDRVIRP